MLRNTVNIALSVSLAIFIVPSTALANWYWISVVSDPDTGYFIEEVSPNTIGYTPDEYVDPLGTKTLVPEGFMDTMDETKLSDRCSTELDSAIQRLRRFDASEDITDPSDRCRGECGLYYTNPQQTLTAREQLLVDIEADAQSCLVDEQQEIQEAIEEQERKEAEEAREAAVAEAVANCDLNFFDTMTTREKMDTYNEREACKAQSVIEETEEVTQPEPVEVTTVPVPQTPPIEAPVVPVTPAAQTNTTPTPIPTPEPIMELENETETSTNTEEASNTPEVIEVDAEPDTPQDSAEEDIVTEPEQRPSFFQRVIRFFTSWF